jgi:hypothetical protein
MSVAARAPSTRVEIRHYRLYGMNIASEVDLAPLPEAEPAGSVALRICRTHIPPAVIERHEPLTFIDTGEDQLFAWAMVGAFRIASDDCIEVDANPGVTDSLVALPLLGTVFAALLQRRGLTVLHASAVALNGRAIVLLGHKGAGKSTTAGTLTAAGHTLVADDVVALEFCEQELPHVLPAAAQLRLWDDSRSALPIAQVTDHGRLHDAVEKSLYSLAMPATAAMPLSRLYLLGRAPHPAIHLIPAAEAVGILLNQSYMARFGERGFGATMPTHFARLARLAASGKARMLAVPAGLDRLGEIAPLVEADLAAG